MYNGKFITFEGGEGCGKSTQATLLSQALRAHGAEVLETREPGGTVGAERIREILLHKEYAWDGVTESLLVFAARRDHMEKKIKPAMREGLMVVCDRFIDSTMAYQGYARGLGELFIETLYSLTSAEVLPDLTILLDIPPEEGLKRAKNRMQTADTFEAQTLRFHEHVRAGFLSIAKTDPDRFLVLDAQEEVDMLHFQIVEAVNTRFGLQVKPYHTDKQHAN